MNPPINSLPLTFGERYCRYWGISAGQFEDHLFRHGLYPAARGLLWLLRLAPGYFSADREFIRSIGLIRSRRFFGGEAGEYQTHPANRHWARRWLKLRVSADRVRRVMDACWDRTPGLDGAPEAPRSDAPVALKQQA